MRYFQLIIWKKRKNTLNYSLFFAYLCGFTKITIIKD